MLYVFLDTGAEYMDDEPLAVGPYDTEEEAFAAAEGRTVIPLVTYPVFLTEYRDTEESLADDSE